jgi:antibiotic biosynthesis monooxygenase (ABM) superfamily enzyme
MPLSTTLVTTLLVESSEQTKCFLWHEQLNEKLSTFGGFSSLEIIPKKKAKHTEWIYVQRFKTYHDLEKWRASTAQKELLMAACSFTLDIAN